MNRCELEDSQQGHKGALPPLTLSETPRASAGGLEAGLTLRVSSSSVIFTTCSRHAHIIRTNREPPTAA